MAGSNPAVARAAGAFTETFGYAPQWVGIAPGRVNLIGEHTDYNGGFVLPMALDRVCAVAAAPAGDPGRCRVFAADLREEWSYPRGASLFEMLGRPGQIARGSWKSYVAGVLHFVGEALELRRDLDLAISSDVPLGSGLSSSASLEVAVAAALMHGRAMEPRQVARLCQRAEHEFAGVPCGIMDQFISAMGKRGHALLIDCASEEARAVPLPPDVRIVIANSGVRHELAGGEYAVRRAGCLAAAQKLGVKSLRSARADVLGIPSLTERERAYARHVISENARTERAAAALDAGNMKAFGKLMSESHVSLRDDFEVSCEELDTLVEIGAGHPGVWGARMTGAGFGGCIVAMTEQDAAESLGEALKKGYRKAHDRTCEVFVSRAGDGASSSEL